MGADRVLEIVLKARDEASAEINKVGKSAGGVSEMLSKSFTNAAIISGAALTGLTVAAVACVAAFDESQKIMAQTNAVLKSTAGVAGVTADEVTYLAGRLMNLTGISDETVQSAENMLLTFTNIGKNIFPETTKTVLDMSVALGQDTKNSAIQLGKALQDPILGVSALRRVGVAFTQSQQDMIKGLVESGNLLDAQKMILKELQTEFGGSAEAAGKTFAGQLNILKETIGNLEETVGGMIANTLSPWITKFKEVADTITNIVGGEETLNSLTQTLSTQFGTIGQTIGQVIEFFGSHKEATYALAGALGGVLLISILAATVAMFAFIGVSLPVILIAGAIGAAAVLIATNWGTIVTVLQPVIDFFKQIFNVVKTEVMGFVNDNMPLFKEAWDTISITIQAGLVIIKNVWDAIWPSLQQVFSGVWNTIKGVFQVIWGLIQVGIAVGLGLITGDWTKAWEMMKKGFEDVWNGIVGVLTGVWETIKGLFKTNINSIIGMLNGFIDLVNGASGKAGVAPIGKIPSLQTGGYVPNNTLAFLHAGEFVLSKAMLEGREPSPVSNTSNFSTPITLGPVYVSDISDIDLLMQRLAFQFDSSGRI